MNPYRTPNQIAKRKFDKTADNVRPASVPLVSATFAVIAFVAISPYVLVDVVVAGFVGGWIGKLRFGDNWKAMLYGLGLVLGGLLIGLIFQLLIFRSLNGFQTWNDVAGLLYIIAFSFIGIFVGIAIARRKT